MGLEVGPATLKEQSHLSGLRGETCGSGLWSQLLSDTSLLPCMKLIMSWKTLERYFTVPFFGVFSLQFSSFSSFVSNQVEASSSGVYIGIHNGHGGTPTSEFLSENLYDNLREQFVGQGGGISADSIRTAFAVTDRTYVELVRDIFHSNPELATVGASSLACIVTANAVWVANLGDGRAVLGQVTSRSFLKSIP